MTLQCDASAVMSYMKMHENHENTMNYLVKISIRFKKIASYMKIQENLYMYSYIYVYDTISYYNTTVLTANTTRDGSHPESEVQMVHAVVWLANRYAVVWLAK